MIRIGKPRVERGESKVRLVSDIRVDGELHRVWAEVDAEYGEYLCYERSDAFVIGLLHWAMVHGHDIECEAPMGEYLYYQITTELIDALSKGSPLMHAIHINAAVDTTELPCAGAVGTGISCGIDSMHVLANHSTTELLHHKITHLTFNNVGSHGEGERAKQLYAERRRRAESFCIEYGFKLAEVNSNIMDEFEQNHFVTHTFTSMFAVFTLQKLYSVYYYASGRTYAAFSLSDTSKDCSFYDLLLAYEFSTDHLRIYSEGATKSRLEKTRKVVDYAPSYKYLNVCISTSQNCSRCEKCTRTLLALDALGRLDDYRAVFDIDYYRLHKSDYLVTLIRGKWKGNDYYEALYPFFRRELTLGIYLRAMPYAVASSIYHSLPQGRLRKLLHSVYHKFKKIIGIYACIIA